jgi:hypothetical protein
VPLPPYGAGLLDCAGETGWLEPDGAGAGWLKIMGEDVWLDWAGAGEAGAAGLE